MTQNVKIANGKKCKPFYFREQIKAEEEYEAAFEWCKANNKGPTACINRNMFKFITASSLQRRLKVMEGKDAKYRQCFFVDKRRLLTLDEERALSDFIQESAEKDNGQSREEITKKIVDILLLRREMNRAGGRFTIPLGQPQRDVIMSRQVSSRFYQDFYARHDELKEFVPRDEDTARYKAACEETVEDHFEGQWTVEDHFEGKRKEEGRKRGKKNTGACCSRSCSICMERAKSRQAALHVLGPGTAFQRLQCLTFLFCVQRGQKGCMQEGCMRCWAPGALPTPSAAASAGTPGSPVNPPTRF